MKFQSRRDRGPIAGAAFRIVMSGPVKQFLPGHIRIDTKMCRLRILARYRYHLTLHRRTFELWTKYADRKSHRNSFFQGIFTLRAKGHAIRPGSVSAGGGRCRFDETRERLKTPRQRATDLLSVVLTTPSIRKLFGRLTSPSLVRITVLTAPNSTISPSSFSTFNGCPILNILRT